MRPLNLTVAVLTLLSTSAFAGNQEAALSPDLRLEPAMNGAVSSTGAFASQAGEDWYRAQMQISADLRAEHQLALLHAAPLDAELEPCMNGAVSPSGTFANAELESIAVDFAKGEMQNRLKNSAYFSAIIEGRLPANR